MKISTHTSQRQSPGYTSWQLDIAYTDGLLNEAQISSAIQLAHNAFVRSISESVVSNCREQRVVQRQAIEQAQEGDTLDEILEQILCQGTHLSAV